MTSISRPQLAADIVREVSTTGPRSSVVHPNATNIVAIADRVILRATPATEEIDWNDAARVVDFVRYVGGAPGIAQVLKALKHQWRGDKANLMKERDLIQRNVLRVIDFCITYVRRSFSARFAGAELWRLLKDAAKYKNLVKSSVYSNLMTYIRAWAINKGSVMAFREFYEKLKSRGYSFPAPGTYEAMRPPVYIPLKDRTDDNVKVKLLQESEKAVEEDDNMSVQGDHAEDAVIEENEDDNKNNLVVHTRVPSFNLIDLLGLDDEVPVPTPGGPAQDPFAAPAGMNENTPANDAFHVSPAPIATGPAPLAPATQGLPGNPFGNPFGDEPASGALAPVGPQAPATPPIMQPTTPANSGNPFGDDDIKPAATTGGPTPKGPETPVTAYVPTVMGTQPRYAGQTFVHQPQIQQYSPALATSQAPFPGGFPVNPQIYNAAALGNMPGVPTGTYGVPQMGPYGSYTAGAGPGGGPVVYPVGQTYTQEMLAPVVDTKALAAAAHGTAQPQQLGLEDAFAQFSFTTKPAVPPPQGPPIGSQQAAAPKSTAEKDAWML